jgi:hypothetical protein
MRNNMYKRNGNDKKKCCFVDEDKTIEIVFISCPFSRLMWQRGFVAFKAHVTHIISNMFHN